MATLDRARPEGGEQPGLFLLSGKAWAPPSSGADQPPPDPDPRRHHLRSTQRVDPGRHCRRRTPGSPPPDSPLPSSELYSRQCGKLWRAVHLTPACSSAPARRAGTLTSNIGQVHASKSSTL
ncbi:hypothetical protein VPH35_088971 [Triticum aestivum]